MTILILHGIGGHAGIHWQQWLHDELVKKGHKVIMPELPDSERPDRGTWVQTVKKELQEVDLSELVIVGHSLGVPTALDFVETLNKPIKALVCVSGFAEDYGAELNSYFMKEREIDLEKVKKNVENVFVLYGDDDPYVPQETLKALADGLGVKPKIFEKGGHLNTDAVYTKLPEVLGTVKALGDNKQGSSQET